MQSFLNIYFCLIIYLLDFTLKYVKNQLMGLEKVKYLCVRKNFKFVLFAIYNFIIAGFLVLVF